MLRGIERGQPNNARLGEASEEMVLAFEYVGSRERCRRQVERPLEGRPCPGGASALPPCSAVAPSPSRPHSVDGKGTWSGLEGKREQ
jgi:hypothetical protein